MELLRTPHDHPPSHLLMLKTAYLDESGHESGQHVIVAGFLGNDDQWDSCAAAWAIGLGKRKGLHMSELRWKSKSSHRVRDLLERLGPIPHRCGLTPVFGGVNVSDYSDMISGTLVTKINKGYILSLYPMIVRILATLKGEERVKLVFEQNTQYQTFTELIGMIVGAFEGRIFKTPSGLPRLSGIEFVTKGSTALTQPADYLAFAILQQHRDPRSQKARWTLPIIGNRIPVGKFMRRDELRKGIGITMAEENIKELREVERWLDPMLSLLRTAKAGKK